jgi:hypothetical protein
MLIGAAMGFDILKVYGGGPTGGGYDPFCFGGTNAQCYTDPPNPDRSKTSDTESTCTGPGKVWGLDTDESGCSTAGGKWGDASQISGYGDKWTPWFLTLGTLSALMSVAVIIYYLIYFRPYTSQLMITSVIAFLLGGVILEYYLMSQYHDTYDGPVSSATYFVIAVNTLVRLWILLDVGCYEAQTTISGVINQELQKAVSKGVAVGTEMGKSAKELENLDPSRFFERLWPTMKQSLESAGLDEQKRRDVRNSIMAQIAPKPATGGRKRR